MKVSNWSIGADGKLESLTLMLEDRQPPRYHILSRNKHTGEFAYQIYDGIGEPKLVYENLTSRQGRK